jgi:pyruvoyl-dependent arginine decarboxylase (PvlArgDC)
MNAGYIISTEENAMSSAVLVMSGHDDTSFGLVMEICKQRKRAPILGLSLLMFIQAGLPEHC